KQEYDEIIIQSNNFENVISIGDSKIIGSKNTLIRRIQQILAFEGKWSLNYVIRETNRIADALAKMVLLGDKMLHTFEEPPLEIKEILKEKFCSDNI
ncbi:hypothetical protein Goshw_020067, partial [Gossypium schwendimanii]|nr:hypothetical protein [Gossypium schwendimanii]